MKQIIIILATIILGVYIGGTLLNGKTTSLKTGAQNIRDEAIEKITTLID